jgi:hypothetical protein
MNGPWKLAGNQSLDSRLAPLPRFGLKHAVQPQLSARMYSFSVTSIAVGFVLQNEIF